VGLTDHVVAELEAARERTLGLVDLSEEDQRSQHSPLMSPLVWDLAHVGNYEELWLLREVGGRPALDASIDSLYDAFRHPRPDRPSLPLLGPAEARTYIGDVRSRVLDVIESVDIDPTQPLLEGGFAFGLVIQHEHQHDETMLATRQLMLERATSPPGTAPPSAGTPYAGPAEVLVPAGTFVMGTDLEPWAYDNERPAHDVDVPAFHIDAVPVTCAAYAEFVADGGYRERRWWTDDGWAWREETGLAHPEFWEEDGANGWTVLRFGRREPRVGARPHPHRGVVLAGRLSPRGRDPQPPRSAPPPRAAGFPRPESPPPAG
jgi:iron(II)-dependent oxidoreductase